MQAPLCVWRESPPALPKLRSQHHYHQKPGLTFAPISQKTDFYLHIWYHRHHQRLIFIFISITEVGNLRYHHITIITETDLYHLITLSWSLPPGEERFWRRVVPRAFASQAVLSPKPIETVMQFPSSPNDLDDIKHSNVCNSRSSLCRLGLVLQITYGKMRVYLRTQRRLNKSLYTAASLSWSLPITSHLSRCSPAQQHWGTSLFWVWHCWRTVDKMGDKVKQTNDIAPSQILHQKQILLRTPQVLSLWAASTSTHQLIWTLSPS